MSNSDAMLFIDRIARLVQTFGQVNAAQRDAEVASLTDVDQRDVGKTLHLSCGTPLDGRLVVTASPCESGQLFVDA